MLQQENMRIDKLSSTQYKPKFAFKNRANDNHDIYNSKRWKSIRQQGLVNEPFCVECLKEGKQLHECKAVVRDHIKPINEGGDAWDIRNHQSLCNRHHNIKSAQESHKGGRG